LPLGHGPQPFPLPPLWNLQSQRAGFYGSLVDYSDSIRINSIYLNMLNKNDILEKLRELKPILSEEFAVKEIGIFGSFANNAASDDSDIDLLVELSRPIGWNYFTLQIYLEGIFGRKVDLVTKNALKEQIKDSILAQVNYA